MPSSADLVSITKNWLMHARADSQETSNFLRESAIFRVGVRTLLEANGPITLRITKTDSFLGSFGITWESVLKELVVLHPV